MVSALRSAVAQQKNQETGGEVNWPEDPEICIIEGPGAVKIEIRIHRSLLATTPPTDYQPLMQRIIFEVSREIYGIWTAERGKSP